MAALAGAKGPVPVPLPQKGNIPPIQVPHSTPSKATVSPSKGTGGSQAPAGPPGPDASLTGPQLYAAAQALSAAKYQPTLQDYANQIAQENSQYANATNQTAGYFNTLGKSIGGLTGEDQRISAILNGQLRNDASTLQQGLGQIGAGAQALTAQYAPPGDPSVLSGTGVQAQLAKQLAEQKGIGAQQSNAFEQSGNQQSANWAQLTNALGGAGRLQGAQDLTQLSNANANRIEPLNAKIGTLFGEQGTDTLNNFYRLRQQEVVNQVARAGLGVRQAGATAGVVNAQAHLTSAEASARNAVTNVAKEQHQAAYQQGQLSVAEQKAAADAKYHFGLLTVAAQKSNNQSIYDAGLLGVDRYKAQALASYNAAKTGQGYAGLKERYAALSEKAQHDLWQHTYQQGELNLRQAAAAAKTGAAGKPGGGKPLSTLENNQSTVMLNETAAFIKSLQGSWKRPQIDQALAQGRYPTQLGVHNSLHSAVNPVLIEAAHELLNKGTLEPRTAKLMSQMGMRGTSYNGSPIRIRK